MDVFGFVHSKNGLIATSFDDFVQKAVEHHYQVCGIPFTYDGLYVWDEDSQRWVFYGPYRSDGELIKYGETPLTNGPLSLYRNPFE